MSAYDLSIIIPVYNTNADLLLECLSVFIDNYDPRLEVIIVDDGSDDVTRQLIESIHLTCSFRIFHQTNCGQNAARELGIEECKGRYVGFIDADDSINWDSLQILLNYISESSLDIVSFSGQYINNDSKYIKDITFTDTWDNINEYVANCAPLWLQVYNKTFLLNHGGLYVPAGAAIGEDLASVLKFAVVADTYNFINIKLYSYRENASSIMHTSHNMQRMSIIDSFNYILGNCGDLYKSEIEWQGIVHLIMSETVEHLRCGFSGIRYAKMLRSYMNEVFPNWKKNKYLRSNRNILIFLCVHKLYIIIIFIYFIKKNFRRLS